MGRIRGKDTEGLGRKKGEGENDVIIFQLQLKIEQYFLFFIVSLALNG